MEEEKIPYAFFKGYELRELYPVPELRTMGDVDVLVRDEDLERTAEVLCGLGYQKEEGGGAVWAFKRIILLMKSIDGLLLALTGTMWIMRVILRLPLTG